MFLMAVVPSIIHIALTFPFNIVIHFCFLSAAANSDIINVYINLGHSLQYLFHAVVTLLVHFGKKNLLELSPEYLIIIYKVITVQFFLQIISGKK